METAEVVDNVVLDCPVPVPPLPVWHPFVQGIVVVGGAGDIVNSVDIEFEV